MSLVVQNSVARPRFGFFRCGSVAGPTIQLRQHFAVTREMRFLYQVLSNFFLHRDCLGCGSYLRTCGFLCPVCWESLTLMRRSDGDLIQHPLQQITVRALFDWTPRESDLLSGLILAHKGNNHEKEWDFAAKAWLTRQALALQSQAVGSFDRKLILIPAPSPRGYGHADEFAQALATLLGATVVRCLKAGSSDKQQNLGRSERAFRQVILDEEFTDQWWGHAVVLIDDVVTTGSTAEVCRQALQLPALEVWCLAHRRRLAASP